MSTEDWSAVDVPFGPGTIVELTKTIVATTTPLLNAYVTLGRRPESSVIGRDYFGVSPGERAVVLAVHDAGVEVDIRTGSWKGRRGWVTREGVRPAPPPPAPKPWSLADPSLRRQIYAALHQVGMDASQLADAKYPFDRMPTDTESLREYLAERETVYKNAREGGWGSVASRFGVEVEHLNAVESEGMAERWPLTDGLSDEEGEIPAFGPVGLDERGRMVLSPEELHLRRDAAIRAIEAVRRLPDDDHPARGDEAMRALGDQQTGSEPRGESP